MNVGRMRRAHFVADRSGGVGIFEGDRGHVGTRIRGGEGRHAGLAGSVQFTEGNGKRAIHRVAGDVTAEDVVTHVGFALVHHDRVGLREQIVDGKFNGGFAPRDGAIFAVEFQIRKRRYDIGGSRTVAAVNVGG